MIQTQGFATRDDLFMRISQKEFDALSPPADVVEKQLRAAEESARADLGIWYDVEIVFQPLPAQTNENGTDARSMLVLNNVVAIALWHIFFAVAPSRTPEHIEKGYKEACIFFAMARKGTKVLDLPLKKNETGKSPTEGVFFANPKMNTQY